MGQSELGWNVHYRNRDNRDSGRGDGQCRKFKVSIQVFLGRRRQASGETHHNDGKRENSGCVQGLEYARKTRRLRLTQYSNADERNGRHDSRVVKAKGWSGLLTLLYNLLSETGGSSRTATAEANFKLTISCQNETRDSELSDA